MKNFIEEFSNFVLMILVVVIGGGYLLSQQGGSFGGGYTTANDPCSVAVSSVATVGPSTSNGSAVILAADVNRVWARIAVTSTSTDPVWLSFDEGSNAVIGNGMMLGPNSTTTQAFVDFGRNTGFPYTGIVKGINALSASSSVLITSCSY